MDNTNKEFNKKMEELFDSFFDKEYQWHVPYNKEDMLEIFLRGVQEGLKEKDNKSSDSDIKKLGV